MTGILFYINGFSFSLGSLRENQQYQNVIFDHDYKNWISYYEYFLDTVYQIWPNVYAGT